LLLLLMKLKELAKYANKIRPTPKMPIQSL
jgi:hypothetical protein